MLGADSHRAVFIAIVTNPIYHSVAATRAFDDNEGLAQVSNWLFLTGSLKQLETTWSKYGVQAQVEPAGSMVAHTELAYVIDPSGHARYILDADPGQGTTSLRSSFAGLIAGELRTVLAGS